MDPNCKRTKKDIEYFVKKDPSGKKLDMVNHLKINITRALL